MWQSFASPCTLQLLLQLLYLLLLLLSVLLYLFVVAELRDSMYTSMQSIMVDQCKALYLWGLCRQKNVLSLGIQICVDNPEYVLLKVLVYIMSADFGPI